MTATVTPSHTRINAIVQERPGSLDGLVLREIEKPAVDDTAVLVRVVAASVNAADWHLTHGLPLVIRMVMARGGSSQAQGADLAGCVEAVGPRVTRFRPGDEVFGAGRGAFAEYAVASEDRVALKPAGLTFEQAAALPIAACTALQGLRDYAHVVPGQRVLVYGAAGGVGTFAVQIAKALGARVTGVTRTGNLDLVRSIGADEAVDYTAEDFTSRGQRYDVVMDLGANRSHAECRRVLTPNGTLLLVGAPAGLPAMLALLVRALRPRKPRRALAYLAVVRRDDLEALGAMVEAGTLRPVIDSRYPLSDVADALRRVGTRQVRGKIVISVS